MYTECPTCNTLFRVHPSQLTVAGGRVRCGECLAVFDAREYLREDLDDPAPPDIPVREPRPAIATPKGRSPTLSTAPQGPRTQAPAARGPASVQQKAVSPPVRKPLVPSPAEAMLELDFRTRTIRSSTGIWLTTSLLLLAILTAQSAYHYREQLAAEPTLRPMLEQICRLAECSLKSKPNQGAFELTGRSVQSHPSYRGGLLIDATFVNRSGLPMPYPQLELVFTNVEGDPVAGRRFLPSEYLGGQPQQALATGAEAHAVLELLDPGDQAVGYEFHFF